MKAVIVMLNSQYIHSSLAPWYLLAGIECYCEKPVIAEVVEGTVNEPLGTVAARITEKSPTVIGLCCYIWNITYIKKLLPSLKKALPDTVIILGGPEVSYNAADILQELPYVDYVLSGEGELPFSRLLDALGSGDDIGAVPGVCRRTGERIIAAPPYCSSDDPPNPYTDAYVKALNGRIAYLETSRGCPFSCAFCLSGRKQPDSRAGESVRFFDMARAKRDLLLLSVSGTKTVKLVDRTFNVNRRRALEIFRFILDRYGKAIPQGVRFHFEIAGDLLDDETLDLLETAPKGALQFEIGLQSFNQKTLEAVNRKTDIERLKNSIQRLVSFGSIHIHIDLIAGLPYEDCKSFAESFNTAYALKPHMLQLGFLKLLHGAPMRENPQLFPCAFSKDPPYQVTGTPWLTPEELKKLHEAEKALDRLYNSGRFRRTLDYTLKKTGFTPFELYLGAGGRMAERAERRLSLDDLTALIFDYFSSLKGVDRAALRDAMACDRLATNAEGRLPDVLKVPDSRLRAVKTAAGIAEKTRIKKGVKRGFALLCAENTAVYADYMDRDPVTGEYELKTIPLPPRP